MRQSRSDGSPRTYPRKKIKLITLKRLRIVLKTWQVMTLLVLRKLPQQKRLATLMMNPKELIL